MQITSQTIEDFLNNQGNYIKKIEIENVLKDILPELKRLKDLCNSQEKEIIELKETLYTEGKAIYLSAIGSC